MMDLKPDARRVLALAQAARSPRASDKARVERKLAVALGAAAVTGATLGGGEALAQAAALAKPAAGHAVYAWLAGALLAAAITTSSLLQPTAEKPARQAARAATQVQAPPATVTETTAPAPERAEQPASPAPPSHTARARPSRAANMDEVVLLQRAQLAWREGSAQRALILLGQHRRSYPRSPLQLERDALRILALCQLGEHGEARVLARALFAASPTAPMRATIEQSCALK